MRIGIAQLWQETNTFNPLRTERADFDQFGVLRGPELLEQLATTNEAGGFIQSLRAWPERPEIVGLVRLPCWPSGPATSRVFDWIREEIVAALRGAGPLDALLIALHGAMVADDHPDVEGDFLAAVREVVGPNLPLVATLDLHANVTRKMFQHADVLTVFHTAPHIDVYETGVRGAAAMRRILIDGVRPTTAWCKLPMVPPVERANTQDPASVSFAWRERLQQLEALPNVLSAGLATVQPWLDVPEMGTTAWVTTADDAPFAETECCRLADDVWRRRDDYRIELASVEEAVRSAHEVKDGLVVLSDCADATTSGAPGDSTWLLRELLKYDWPRGAAVTMVAPEVVERAAAVGVGHTFTTPIGGRRDHRFSQPIEVTVVVEQLFDAKFVLTGGHLGKNFAVDMGRSALLRVGDVRIVVTSKSGPHFAPELFRAAGLDPFALNVLIAKSPCGFRAAYAERAAKILVVRAPGCAPPDFWNYDYHRIPRPLWPWDADLAFHPQVVRKPGV
jgi:microcystin degradation protein MlrC